ncbi:hypothetical protein GCM10022403_045730 [Streptomyces coacervatus]|uniref:Secreted protein n=1 Tax=Streptomyces coacervatus TaxID=647381 RepID=A0ABP7HXA3_9ACTN
MYPKPAAAAGVAASTAAAVLVSGTAAAEAASNFLLLIAISRFLSWGWNLGKSRRKRLLSVEESSNLPSVRQSAGTGGNQSAFAGHFTS